MRKEWRLTEMDGLDCSKLLEELPELELACA